ncbi:hypothetical protein CI109_105375 [Kwoniella shandongensis]|uniref:Uncharacterized protein n=1 Tax=Kwoniella shandongensis TaxID=1734106 RepID=A0A5M6BR18_9TREE|nr:uncharacterized protein CI109_006327 [Kwoniella shandongensis]KAA5525348.1 hypothetical protein CI109_006327 [Kwoniella shandongensis]
MPVPTAQHTSLPLHRIRFYDHTPSPITALSFAPLPLPPPQDPSSSKGKAKGTTSADGQKDEFGVLIVARDNGEVEIWQYVQDDEGNMSGNWVLEKTLPPTLTHPTISLMSLVIRDPLNFHRKSYAVPKVEDLRLFTAGSDSGDLIERCLITGRVLQTYAIPSPPLWSLSVSPTHDLLCLATTSPSLHFLSIPQPTYFTPSPPLSPPPSHLLRSDTLPSRTRTVSIAWGVPKVERVMDSQDEWEWRNTYLITGNSDSSFRKWDIPPPLDPSRSGLNRVILKSRSVVEKLGKPGRGGKKPATGMQKATIVWGVGVLPDNNIVTSDSLGNVTFWDGVSLAQKQNFRAHKADGMCMTIGPNGRSVFTSGPDQRVCQFVNVPSTSGSGSQWALTASRRLHSHDVKALAIFPPYVPLPSSHPLTTPPINPSYAPVLASGGWDMSLSLTSAGNPDLAADKVRNALAKPKGAMKPVFEESYSRKLGYLSGGRGNGRLEMATKARLVLGRKERSVGVWRVLEDEQGWEKALEMELRLRTNIISSSISSDGRWLAVSDLYETKLFHLASSSGSNTLHPTRIRDLLPTLHSSPMLAHLSLPTKGCGSSTLLFTPDSQRLVLGLVASGQIVVLELPEQPKDGVNVVKCFARQDKIVDGRVVKGKKATANGHTPNGDVNGDVDMDKGVEEEVGSGSEDETEDEAEKKQEEQAAWISSLAASEDGQWLGVSDLAGRVSVFNLDTLQLYATLPTLPFAPISIGFPPSTPSLLSLTLPTNSLQFYHLDLRRLLPATQQLASLNSALSSLHSPVHGTTFEPISRRAGEKTSKTLIWGSDWLVTARLDLDAVAKLKSRRGSESPSVSLSLDGSPVGGLSKAMRKKRAREAREQRTQIDSASPSVVDSSELHANKTVPGEKEEFYKIVKDRFKSVLGVGWLASTSTSTSTGTTEGEVEVAVVERPWGDFVGDLPGAFWSGTFGRS